jgi:hypothetical protein
MRGMESGVDVVEGQLRENGMRWVERSRGLDDEAPSNDGLVIGVDRGNDSVTCCRR